ncbi:hypothetical protein [Clostridium beijerinckii]|uniref:hypothetical protein n=1 Tax=Clostridium beijerinckii TaxID=1520 RepID=UPI00098CB485|nr:hypothetical protein [Clostridium beijerinckii]NRT76978.1 hypothetical protein [Clostridium beijerinckii]OOM36126.1 hypothetical protein CBEIJ_51730 [Clostridium beijerinckii]
MDKKMLTEEFKKLYNQDNRIAIRLQSSKENILSGWQLQEFINCLSNSYYKIDIIEYISDQLGKGSNFFIMNESFKINNNYKKIKKSKGWDFKNKEHMVLLYNLGKPIPLIPDIKIYRIYYIFSFYEEVYKQFGKFKIDKIDKKLLTEIIDREDGIENFKKIVDYYIEEAHLTHELKQVIKKNVNRIYSDINSDMEKIHKDVFYIDILKRNILTKKEDEIEELNEDNYKIIEQKYFMKFFEMLKKIERPVVFEYKEDVGIMRVIKKEYMCNDKSSKNFFDVKKYIHNSPFEIIFIGGTMLLPMIFCAISNYNKGKKIDQVNVQSEASTTLENLDSKIDKNVYEDDEVNQKGNVYKIKKNYIGEKFIDVNEIILEKVFNQLNNKSLINENLTICSENDMEDKMNEIKNKQILEVAKNLIGILDDETIASKTGIPIENVLNLRKKFE